MKYVYRIFAIAAMSTLAIMNTGCNETKDSSSSSSTGFSAADIVKSWTSSCITGSYEPVTGSSSEKITITFNSDSSYSSTAYWYSNSTCNAAGYAVAYSTAGTYSVGGYQNGSNTITLSATSYELMPWNTTVQTAFNTDCGGTSPFDSGAHGVSSSNNGGHFSTQAMLCQSITLPNSTRATILNIGTLSSGVLSIGLPTNASLPGFYSGDTLPTSATVQLF